MKSKDSFKLTSTPVKVKCLIIRSCAECPKHTYHMQAGVHQCHYEPGQSLPGIPIEDPSIIPDFCPLKDFDQQINSIDESKCKQCRYYPSRKLSYECEICRRNYKDLFAL